MYTPVYLSWKKCTYSCKTIQFWNDTAHSLERTESTTEVSDGLKKQEETKQSSVVKMT